MADVLSVISNVAFMLPSGQSMYLRHWTRAVLFFFMIFASSFYHACNSWTGHCTFDANIHRKTDFFFAQLLIPVTALYLIKFKGVWCFVERVLIMLAAATLFVVEVLSNEPFIIQVIISMGSFALIIGYWIGYAVYMNHKEGAPRIPNYDWEAMVLGVGCTALACTLFATQRMWHAGYPWVHSIWHVLAAFGQYWVLNTRPKRGPIYPVLDKGIQKRVDNEMDN